MTKSKRPILANVARIEALMDRDGLAAVHREHMFDTGQGGGEGRAHGRAVVDKRNVNRHPSLVELVAVGSRALGIPLYLLSL